VDLRRVFDAVWLAEQQMRSDAAFVTALEHLVNALGLFDLERRIRPVGAATGNA
jgi:hypothetical protein